MLTAHQVLPNRFCDSLSVARFKRSHSGLCETRFHCEVRRFYVVFLAKKLDSHVRGNDGGDRGVDHNRLGANSLLPSAEFRGFLSGHHCQSAHSIAAPQSNQPRSSRAKSRDGIERSRDGLGIVKVVLGCARTGPSTSLGMSGDGVQFTVTFRSFPPFSPHKPASLERSHHPPPRHPRSQHRPAAPAAHRAARSLCLG
jgi:hypothetical protein